MPLNFLEPNAVFLHNFWQPQPTLPCLGSNIPSARRPAMQGIFAESSLCKQARRNHKEGRVVCLHEESDAFTSEVPRPASPSPKSPNTRPDVPVPLLYIAELAGSEFYYKSLNFPPTCPDCS